MPNNQDYAVIIGIKNYDVLKSLEAPIEDAESFSEWLKDREGGDVPKENVKFIENINNSNQAPYPPILDNIDDALLEIIDQGQGTGYRRLYFFFSGHGIGVNWNEVSLCLPKWSESRLNYAMSTNAYLNYFVTSNLFDEVFFFLDCCRTRKIGVQGLPPAVNWPRQGGKQCRNIMTMHATDYEDVAREGWVDNATGSHITGYFSKALIEGLKGGATDPFTGNITIDSLHNFVTRRTKELAAAKGHVQNAQLSLPKTTGNFVIKPSVVTNINTTINFTKSGVFTLYGPPGITAKQTGAVTAGESWQLELYQGLYMISNDNMTNKELFAVEFSINPFIYEY